MVEVVFSMNTFQSCITNHLLSVITNKRILAKGRKREVPSNRDEQGANKKKRL